MAKKKSRSQRFGNPVKNAKYQDNTARLHSAVLSKNESQLFYKTFMPLLGYINRKFSVFDSESVTVGEEKVIMDYDRALMSISEKLWQQPSLFDEYIDSEKETLPVEHKELLNGWKRFVNGRFAVVRHRKNGSVFVDLDTEKVYFAKGIVDTIEQLTEDFTLPVVILTTLLPFKNIIICSGHVAVAYKDSAENAETIYQEAKKNGTIITEL